MREQEAEQKAWNDDIVRLLSAPGKLLASQTTSRHLPAGYGALLPLALARYLNPSASYHFLLRVALACELLLCALDFFDEIEDNDHSPVRDALGDGRLLNGTTVLFVLAFRLIATSATSRDEQRCSEQVRTLLEEELLCAMDGQHRDIQAESLPYDALDAEQSLSIIAAKSGALLRMVCQVSAVASQATPALVALVSEMGCALGIAFQLENDVHDLEVALVSPKEHTSNFKSDLERAKKTFPLVLAYQRYAALQNQTPSADSEQQAGRESMMRQRSYQDAITATLGSAVYQRLCIQELAQDLEQKIGQAIPAELRLLLGLDRVQSNTPRVNAGGL